MSVCESQNSDYNAWDTVSKLPLLAVFQSSRLHWNPCSPVPTSHEANLWDCSIGSVNCMYTQYEAAPHSQAMEILILLPKGGRINGKWSSRTVVTLSISSRRFRCLMLLVARPTTSHDRLAHFAPIIVFKLLSGSRYSHQAGSAQDLSLSFA
jgi:hypothetical protein